MSLLVACISIVLSIFSTTVMSYISMATGIGPWIAPTIVLFAMFIFATCRRAHNQEQLVLVTVAASIGGILATACGFSVPTLYFLDPVAFAQWMSHPLYFASILAGLSLSAGGLGFFIANMVEQRFIERAGLAYPVGALVHGMITAHDHIRRTYELVVGFFGTVLFCFLQDGLFSFRGIIAKSITLVPSLSWGWLSIPAIALDIWPLLWAIGFVTGHVIAWPLVVGALSKIFVLAPLHTHVYTHISFMEFTLAFCSGMVLVGVLSSFIKIPKLLQTFVRGWKDDTSTTLRITRLLPESTTTADICKTAFIALFMISFLTYFGFSFHVQLYLIVFTAICTYEMAYVAGKIGLAQLGRYATFVMVPALFLFELNVTQIVLIATFVEICGGVAVDILFGRKLARLSSADSGRVHRYQYLGLVVSAITIGIVFWLLISHFSLGSAELYAQKAQSRHLLVNARSFNYSVLAVGIIFGLLLQQLGVNPSLVLGGILMPINISLGLCIGGLGAWFATRKEEYFPFWSGVFAANSLWMLLKCIL